MSRKLFFLLLLWGAFGHDRALAQGGCGLIDKAKPLLFISYERTAEVEKNEEVQLRLSNNSTCAIVVHTYEEPPNKSLTEVLSHSSVCAPSTFLELPDGAPVSMQTGLAGDGSSPPLVRVHNGVEFGTWQEYLSPARRMVSGSWRRKR